MIFYLNVKEKFLHLVCIGNKIFIVQTKKEIWLNIQSENKLFSSMFWKLIHLSNFLTSNMGKNYKNVFPRWIFISY